VTGASLRHPFLVGDKVYLRPLEAADLDGPYLGWLNDYDVTRFMETGSTPITSATLQRYVDDMGRAHDTVMLAIVDKATGDHVGNIKLGPVHPLHRRADVGVMIGDKRYWDKGYAREAVSLMVQYGFQRLNLNKITLGVYADHVRAIKVYEHLGFMIEGTQRRHLFRDGDYHDRHIMGILRDEWKGTIR
jgi:RimJ/RimL family protein N-acetyltransferase